MVTAFTLWKALRLRNVSFFYFCSPGLGFRVLDFAVWACLPPGWNGGFRLWRLSGESFGRGRAFFDRLILPDSRALGAGLPGLPGSWSLELLPLSRSGCVQLPLPHLWVILPAWYRSSAPSPNQVARWRGGSGAWLPFSFSFGVFVTPRILGRELEWDFPSGCSSFSLRGCPASALAVVGNGCGVFQACPFFGTVTLFPFKTLLFPSYAPRCRYDVPGVLASGSGLAASA